MKMYSLLLAVPLLFAACGSDNDNGGTGGGDNGGSGGGSATVLGTVIKSTARLTLDVTTDKAVYKPGETVTFTLTSGSLPASARVRYRKGAEVVADQVLTASTWTWTAPSTDFTGYMADIYTSDGDKAESVYATVGVDVSSSWSRYPRYGFIASYGTDKTADVRATELRFLNRCHINGLQFYDWQYKHHWPLGGKPGALLPTYTDIANRTISTDVVKGYIATAHQYGMKAMFYNLCFGTLDDAAADGVKASWAIFKDNARRNQDKHQLPDSWKSDIYLVDPSNSSWQSYLADRNDEVYEALDFDGFHIDQLGDRGTVYDYYGGKCNLRSGYASLIKAMKERQPDKSLVMNAVSNWGSENILGTGKMDFMYSELWGGESSFSDLLTILNANNSYSGGKLGQVYAAYMDYSHKSSTFNTPGVLLTDAVMFAIGASHLELGDGHMLSSEYFPYSDVKMSDELRQAIVRYYDFLTAYQNLLRDGGTQTTAALTSQDAQVKLNAWPPVLGGVTTFSREVGGKQVVHLLNFRKADNLSWRDMDGTMPEPDTLTSLTLRLKAKGVKKLWVASPDTLGGAPQELTFRQEGDYVTFAVPSLKYWTMIVAE